MVAIQIRDMPDAVRDDLAAEAHRRGISLQTYLRDVLTRAAKQSAQLRWLDEQRNRARPPVSRKSPTATDLIRQYRDLGY